MLELMRSLGVCVGTVVALAAAGASGAGCHTGGMLTGAGGGGTLSGIGGRAAGGQGGASIFVGSGGVGPATGAAGYPNNGCGARIPAVPVPPKIEIVLDTSASMNDAADGSCTGSCGSGSKWSAVVGGIDAAVGADGVVVEWALKFMTSPGYACDTGAVDV